MSEAFVVKGLLPKMLLSIVKHTNWSFIGYQGSMQGIWEVEASPPKCPAPPPPKKNVVVITVYK